MKVVIFGGNGYIGQQVIRKLVTKLPSSQITVVSRTSGAMKGDITDKKSVANCIRAADVIANFVGIMEPTGQSFQSAQVDGPRNIVESLGKDQKFVHISALGIDAQVTDYQRTKVLGEEVILNSGKSCLILRPGLVIGEQDKFLNRFAKLLRLFPAFPLFGGGTSLYQPIYVQNLADIVVNAINTKFDGQSLVEVGGPDVMPFSELLSRTTRWHSLTGWKRKVMPPFLFPLPTSISMMQAWLMEQVTPYDSDFRVTQDQVRMLQQDNIVQGSTQQNPKLIKVLKGSSNLAAQLTEGVDFKKLDQLFKDGKWVT